MLTCNEITKSYGVNLILNNISFKIEKNDRVGIVGRNGSGKTTLFKIITQKMEFDSGYVSINKNYSIGYLSQLLDLNEENTIYSELLTVFEQLLDLEKEIHRYQNLMSTEKNLDSIMDKYSLLVDDFENMGGYEYQSRIRGVLKGLGFEELDYDKKIGDLSGGQKTRIALSKLLLETPDLLLLDEPTNYLDINATEWLESYLSSYQGALMIISHDRFFLDALVNRIFEIENHKLNEYKGNYTDYVHTKKENLDTALHQYQVQQKEIRRQQEIIKRFRQFNREKSIKKAESREKMLEKMDVLEQPIVFQKKPRITFDTQIKSGNIVLDAIDLKKSFDDNLLFENANFTILRGEKVGIIGGNGTGKTTLLNMIKGNLPWDKGEIIIGHNVNMGFFYQEHDDLVKENTVLDEVWSSKSSANEGEIRSFLGAFMFTGEDVYKNVGSLSGGEASRVALAKIMLSKSNFLLMDEPTNHLDMETKDILENALINYSGTVLLISHDRYFINRVASKLIVLDNKEVRVFNGNYDYYTNKLNEQRLLEELSKETITITKTQLANKKKQDNIQKQYVSNLKKEVLALETKISEVEDSLSSMESLMCQENFYDNFEEASTITNEYEKIKEELSRIMDIWTEKQIELEELN